MGDRLQEVGGGEGGEEVQQRDWVAAGGHAHLGQALIILPLAEQVVAVPQVDLILQAPVCLRLHLTHEACDMQHD